MNDELYHHGVEGMSWGKRNGPPYPLNASGKASLRKQLFRKKKKQQTDDVKRYSDMSDEEKTEAKQKAIREGNIREAYANKDEYSDQELQAVRNRFRLNQEVSQLARENVKTGKQKADEIASKFETVARLTNAVANTAVNGIKIYNSLGAVMAKVNGTNFQPINTGGGNNKKKKKGGNK